MHRWDFEAAYLKGSLLPGEVVYCSPPSATFRADGSLVEGKDDGKFMAIVQKPVYGMAQAGRRWQRGLYDWLKECGFRQMKSDNCSSTVRAEKTGHEFHLPPARSDSSSM